MKLRIVLSSLAVGMLAAWIAPPASAQKPAAPSADAILRQMSDTLTAAHQFSFKASRVIGAATASQKDLQANAQIEVIVRRPNDVVAISTNGDDIRTLFFDGHSFTLFAAKDNMYSSVQVTASLDALPEILLAKYGMVPPLADFVVSNPYKDMHFRAKTISYAGTEPCPPAPSGDSKGDCYRLKLTGEFADSEFLIAVSDHLPRQITSTLNGSDAGGSVALSLFDWNLSALTTDGQFTFKPPAGAVSIPMVTTADVQAAENKQP